MGVFAGPEINQNGLVLSLDAANLKSYPGSGTTWFDLSNNQINSTLINGVSYSTDNQGTLVFDGTNDYINAGNSFNTIAGNGLFCESASSFTVSVWFRWVTTPSVYGSQNASHCIVGRAGGIGNLATFAIFGSINSYNNGASGSETLEYGKLGVVIRGVTTIASPITVNNTNWYNSLFTWDGTTGKIYFNGDFYKNAGIGTAVRQEYNLGFGNREGVTFDSVHRLQGSISFSQIYNRALSAIEIAQNFNAYRGRYGI